MNPTRIFLVRHGQVVGHEEKRYNGHADVEITQHGQEQYRKLRDRLADVSLTAVYSSDLVRCRWGAELIAASHSLQPHFRQNLRELHIGDWEGMTWGEIQERWPREWQDRLSNIVDYRVPGGESTRDLAERAIPVIREIVARHQGEDVLVVGHGGLNRVILLDALGAPLTSLFSLEQNFACLNIIDYYADGVTVVKLVNSSEGLP